MKKIISLVLVLGLFSALLLPAACAAEAAPYGDVPAGFWAAADIAEARALGVMQGISPTSFGLGQSVKRSEFVAMVVRLFGWKKETPAVSGFADVLPSSWFFSDVATALAHGAIEPAAAFRPEAPITREEMAVMLTAALGYGNLIRAAEQSGNPFTDVTDHRGMITLAYDFGIIGGTTPTTFAPKQGALREEAAAMVMRLARKLGKSPAFSTGFYAVAAASQMELIPDFSSICFGWGRLDYDGTKVYVNQTKADGNDWFTPAGYETPLNIAKESQTPALLAVFLSASQKQNGTAVASAVMQSADLRKQGASALAAAAEDGGFQGLCLDFEGFRGETMKQSFSAFLQELSPLLKAKGLTLYVTVPPAVRGQPYFDGYDYAAIGRFADKVILMAYDYEATFLNETYQEMGYSDTPLTPFAMVYDSIKQFVDPKTGVPKEKAVLGLCFDSAQWKIKDGKTLNNTPYRPGYAAIEQRLLQKDTKISYDTARRNPVATYDNSEDGTQNVIWYEDTRSFRDKIQLAELFGITGISTWRLGQIPKESAASHFDFWSEIYKNGKVGK